MKKLFFIIMLMLVLASGLVFNLSGCVGASVSSAAQSIVPSTPAVTPSPTLQITQNQQPVEVVSVLEPPQEPNPGGGIVEITLKNVGIEPVVSLTAVLTIRGPFNYSFDVTPSHPLLPGESISSQLRLVGSNDGFGDGIPYSVMINGALQDGDTFSYTRDSPDK